MNIYGRAIGARTLRFEPAESVAAAEVVADAAALVEVEADVAILDIDEKEMESRQNQTIGLLEGRRRLKKPEPATFVPSGVRV